MRIDVTPVLSGLNPSRAAPGATVTLTGNGFAPGTAAEFGGRRASTSFGSTLQVSAIVPLMPPGQTSVVVTVAAQSSSALPFVVLVPPPTSSQIVFRSSDSEVESFDFSNPAQPTLIDHQSATPATAASPNLAFDSAGHLLRTTSSDVQAFTVTADGHMTLLATESAQPSSTGVAVAAGGTTVFRAIDTGLQSFQLSGNSLGSAHSTNGTVSAAGVGLDVFGGIAVRAHPTGIDVFDIHDPTNVRLLGSNGMGVPSMTGVDVKIFAGMRAIRAESNGIEIYDLSQPAAPALIGANNAAGTPSSAGVAIAVDAASTRAVRVTPNGIEVYDLTAGGFPLLGNLNSTTSPTGVGAAISGTTVFRGLASGIEAFSITNPRNPVRLGGINATPAFTGVGLTGR